MTKKYAVHLEESERSPLLEIVRKGKHSSRKVRRAQTLLMAEEGQSDELIARTLKTSLSTVERTRKQFVEEGLDAALSERSRSGRPPKLSGPEEALVVATACSTPPEGRSHWTMKLLAGRVVELGIVERIAPETVRQTLKKRSSSRGSVASGASAR
jgi:transposase